MTSTLNAIIHGQNSTAQAVWHPNPTVRGTWDICQTCVVGEDQDQSPEPAAFEYS
jgi:hypothetical protein